MLPMSPLQSWSFIAIIFALIIFAICALHELTMPAVDDIDPRDVDNADTSTDPDDLDDTIIAFPALSVVDPASPDSSARPSGPALRLIEGGRSDHHQHAQVTQASNASAQLYDWAQDGI